MKLFSKKDKSEKETTKKAAGKQNARDVPEKLKKYGFRVSTPYGLYPEDVETKILELEDTITRLAKENRTLEEGYTNAQNERDILKAEITRLKINASKPPVMPPPLLPPQPAPVQQIIEVPPSTVEQDMARLAMINTITGKTTTDDNHKTQSATTTSTTTVGGLEIVNIK